MAIFMVSDLELGHNGGLGPPVSGREFATAKEHDSALVSAWNKTVRQEDTVYFLGDLAHDDPAHWLGQLNGRIIAVLGNHDGRHKQAFASRCERVYQMAAVVQLPDGKGGEMQVLLSHFPHISWPQSHNGAAHLYGHMHESLVHWGRALDVCVSARNQWRPWAWDSLREALLAIPPAPESGEGCRYIPVVYEGGGLTELLEGTRDTPAAAIDAARTAGYRVKQVKRYQDTGRVVLPGNIKTKESRG